MIRKEKSKIQTVVAPSLFNRKTKSARFLSADSPLTNTESCWKQRAIKVSWKLHNSLTNLLNRKRHFLFQSLQLNTLLLLFVLFSFVFLGRDDCIPLASFVKVKQLRLFCPVSGWGRKSVTRAVIVYFHVLLQRYWVVDFTCCYIQMFHVWYGYTDCLFSCSVTEILIGYFSWSVTETLIGYFHVLLHRHWLVMFSCYVTEIFYCSLIEVTRNSQN